MKRLVLCSLVCLSLLTAVAHGRDRRRSPEPTPDDRVIDCLEDADLNYDVTAAGDVRVVLALGEGSDRTHHAFITSSTNDDLSTEVRQVWAIAAQFPSMPDAELLEKLMVINSQLPYGSWGVVRASDAYVVVFQLSLAADCDPVELVEAIAVTIKYADELEEVLTDADEL